MTSSLRIADCTRTRCRAGVLVVVAMFAVSAACLLGLRPRTTRGRGPPTRSSAIPTAPIRSRRLPDDVALPIVFVHGFAGSAQQYESQAMRFVANGYPAGPHRRLRPRRRRLRHRRVRRGPDRRSSTRRSPSSASSRCTWSATRAGRPCRAPSSAILPRRRRWPSTSRSTASRVPTVVPCVAPTQAEFPGQSHVEVATSKESFAMQYEFLVGEAPEVVDIVPQRDPVEISGRAVNFPANTGRERRRSTSGPSTPTAAPASATSPTPRSSSAPTASSAPWSSRPEPTTSTRSPAISPR